MKLYTNPASPFVRKAAVVAHEVGCWDKIESIPVGGMPTQPESLLESDNPLGKIPTLVPDSGPHIYDSRTICRYLNDVAGARLYPEPPRLWEALTLEATGDGIMEAAVLMVYEFRCRDEAIRSAEWVEAQWSKIARTLDAFEADWMEYLSGPLDIGHISVGCALGYLDLRHDKRNWREGKNALSNWFAELSERVSMKETFPSLPT